MAAPTQYYVRPVNGSDTTGDGLSHATAWQTTQKALNTIVRNATDGDQVNVCSEGDDVLSAPLDPTTYGIASITAPLIIRGYTAATNDGGIGSISGGGSVSILSSVATSNWNHIYVDMKLGNCGVQRVFFFGGGVTLIHCEIYEGLDGFMASFSGSGWTGWRVFDCYFHDLSASAGSCQNGGIIHSCYFKNGATKKFTTALSLGGNTPRGVYNCIFDLDGASVGMGANTVGATMPIIGNTIYKRNSTGGSGITMAGTPSGIAYTTVLNNIVVGFNTVGAAGISLPKPALYGHNKVYNCTTAFVVPDPYADLGGNEVLAENPFVDPDNGDFSLKAAYKAAGWPSSFLGSNTDQFIDPGAAQRQEAGGSRKRIVIPGTSLRVF